MLCDFANTVGTPSSRLYADTLSTARAATVAGSVGGSGDGAPGVSVQCEARFSGSSTGIITLLATPSMAAAVLAAGPASFGARGWVGPRSREGDSVHYVIGPIAPSTELTLTVGSGARAYTSNTGIYAFVGGSRADGAAQHIPRGHSRLRPLFQLFIDLGFRYPRLDQRPNCECGVWSDCGGARGQCRCGRLRELRWCSRCRWGAHG
jgi:hypothetical protein